MKESRHKKVFYDAVLGYLEIIISQINAKNCSNLILLKRLVGYFGKWKIPEDKVGVVKVRLKEISGQLLEVHMDIYVLLMKELAFVGQGETLFHTVIIDDLKAEMEGILCPDDQGSSFSFIVSLLIDIEFPDDISREETSEFLVGLKVKKPELKEVIEAVLDRI